MAETSLSTGPAASANVIPDDDVTFSAGSQDELECLTLTALQNASLGEHTQGVALVLRSSVATDRKQQRYLMLTVRGLDGVCIEGRWWRYPYPSERCPKLGHVYLFTGIVDQFEGQRQLTITRIRAAAAFDPAAFVRSAYQPAEQLRMELAAWIEQLDPEMAALVSTVLADETYERFCTWPAAQHHHGAVRNGLLAHSLAVAQLVHALAGVYGFEHLPYDTGLATAACLLHDIGKTKTLPPLAGTELPAIAQYADHVTLGAIMIRDGARSVDPPMRAERLEQLLHAVLAHHGRKEWGAPIDPQTVETWLVHLADLAESRLWHFANEERPQ